MGNTDFVFDTSQMPLVRAGIPGDITASRVGGYVRALDSLLESGDRFGLIFDASSIGQVDRVAVTLHADLFKRQKERCAKQWIALALVFDGAGPRFLLSTLLLAVRIPVPYEIVSSIADGERYVAGRFRAEQMTVPPSLRAALR